MTLLRRAFHASAFLAVGAIGFFAPDALAYVSAKAAPTASIVIPESQAYIKRVPATESASVRVVLPDGLGSGVSIGNGFIVTAAHVVVGQKQAKIKTRDGADASASVLWGSPEYDIALLHTDTTIPSADLDCRTARVGTPIMAVGNPLGMEFISSFGKIAGSPREFAPTWKSVFVADMTVIMGSSGGPVFDDNGSVVGIVVGVLGVPGANDSKSYLGLSTVVPSSVVCSLLGRTK